MKMKVSLTAVCRIIFPLAGAFTFVASVCAQKRKSARRSDKAQTYFGFEEDVKKPVKLPEDVLQQLVHLNREELDRCLESDEERKAKPGDIAVYFAASEIDLNGDGRTDLIVQPNPKTFCLQRNSGIPFWIFVSGRMGYKLIYNDFAYDLGVLRTRTKGFRDIEISSHTIGENYIMTLKFDGSEYKLAQSRIEKIGEN